MTFTLSPQPFKPPSLPRWEAWARAATQTLRPETYGDLVDVLRSAHRTSTPLHVMGSGRHTRYLPDLDATILELRGLHRVTEWDGESLILTAQAGATFGELEVYAAQRSASLATWRREHPEATVGGLLGAYRPGPVGLWDGSVQSACLGLGMVTAQGGSYRYTPAPRKASGPDLRHAFFASEGALGVIAHAALSVAPEPELSRAFCVEGLPFVDALRWVQALNRAGLRAPNMLYSGASRTFWIALEGARVYVELMESILRDVGQVLGCEVQEMPISLYYRPEDGDVRLGADPCVQRPEDPRGAVALWSTLRGFQELPEALTSSCVLYDITHHTASLWCPLSAFDDAPEEFRSAAELRSVWFNTVQDLSAKPSLSSSSSVLKHALDPHGIFPAQTPWGARRVSSSSSEPTRDV